METGAIVVGASAVLGAGFILFNAMRKRNESKGVRSHDFIELSY